MPNYLNKRSYKLIHFIERWLWPLISLLFRVRVQGVENIPSQGPILFVANHNIGALIESHSALFTIQKHLTPPTIIYGLTHPSIFKTPLISQYFEWIGAVPATYEVSEDIFRKRHALLIFPGGNNQALRPVWKYRDNAFRSSHGWAKMAITHNVPVLTITFKRSHFLNPVLLSGHWLSKLLILPRFLGLKVMSITMGQILISFLIYKLSVGLIPMPLAIILTYLAFIFTPLAICIPIPISMQIHPQLRPSDFNSQAELEEAVAQIMDKIYI